MQALWRRYRWWLVLPAFLLLLWLGRVAVDAMLPMEGWLHRGWYALRYQNYPEAERCFQRAARKNPASDLPKIALLATYEREAERPTLNLPKAIEPITYLLRIRPLLWKHAMRRWKIREDAAHRHWNELASDLHPRLGDRINYIDFPSLFVDDWHFNPEAFHLLMTGCRAARANDTVTAWRNINTLINTYPQVYQNYCRLERNLPAYTADIAWRGGATAQARAMTATLKYPRNVAYIYLSLPDSHPFARMWTFQNGYLQHGQPITRESRLVLVPGTDELWLLGFPINSGFFTNIQWWRWKEDIWQPIPADLLNALISQAQTVNAAIVPSTANGMVAQAGNTMYLLLQGSEAKSRPILTAITDRVTPIVGYSPKAIAVHDGELWIDNGYDLTRRGKDGFDVQYRGRQVTQVGGFLGGTETLGWLPFTLDPAWTPATDRAGALWLVSWNGIDLVPRAAWTGKTFRPATSAEIAAAKGGFLDVTGCIRRPAELPRGFARDAWRTLPGLPKNSSEAKYAVDGCGRVWLVSGCLAARWEKTGWVSINNRFPGPGTVFDAISPAGNGVVVSLNAGVMVGYVE